MYTIFAHVIFQVIKQDVCFCPKIIFFITAKSEMYISDEDCRIGTYKYFIYLLKLRLFCIVITSHSHWWLPSDNRFMTGLFAWDFFYGCGLLVGVSQSYLGLMRIVILSTIKREKEEERGRR